MSIPRPDKYGFTLILSSPAHFIAEFESERFRLTHAWPTFGAGAHAFDPFSRYSRNFFALTFTERERSPQEEQKRMPPAYSFVGDYFCVFLSLYFGKRFENHGFLLDHGHYTLPNIQAPRPRKQSELAFSSNPRKDLNIELSFEQAAVLIPILDRVFEVVDGADTISDDINTAYTAGRFYQQALQLYEDDAELSFLSLVNAGEVLVSSVIFNEDELKDEQTDTMLVEIEEKLTSDTATKLKKMLFGQISRRFRVGLAKLLNETFYNGSECTNDFLKLKPESILKHLKAAYAVRSQFLHSGTRFGQWVLSLEGGSEIMVGVPAYGSSDWKKLISNIPTLYGLERVIRFCLLRFIHQRISRIHSLLK